VPPCCWSESEVRLDPNSNQNRWIEVGSESNQRKHNTGCHIDLNKPHFLLSAAWYRGTGTWCTGTGTLQIVCEQVPWILCQNYPFYVFLRRGNNFLYQILRMMFLYINLNKWHRFRCKWRHIDWKSFILLYRYFWHNWFFKYIISFKTSYPRKIKLCQQNYVILKGKNICNNMYMLFRHRAILWKINNILVKRTGPTL
jgi:hypothetical protein